MSTKRKTRRKDRTLLSFKKERKIDLTARICQGLREVKLTHIAATRYVTP